jgi:hypothetical protein
MEGCIELFPVYFFPSLNVAMPTLALGVDFDTALPDRAHQCLIIALVLPGTGSRLIFMSCSCRTPTLRSVRPTIPVSGEVIVAKSRFNYAWSR